MEFLSPSNWTVKDPSHRTRDANCLRGEIDAVHACQSTADLGNIMHQNTHLNIKQFAVKLFPGLWCVDWIRLFPRAIVSGLWCDEDMVLELWWRFTCDTYRKLNRVSLSFDTGLSVLLLWCSTPMRFPTFGATVCFRLTKARQGHGVSLEACSLQDASIHDLNTLSLFATARKHVLFVSTARRVQPEGFKVSDSTCQNLKWIQLHIKHS